MDKKTADYFIEYACLRAVEEIAILDVSFKRTKEVSG